MAVRRTSQKHRNYMFLMREYKKETKKTDIDMKELAEWAVQKRGIPLPKQPSPIDLLAADMAQAAREETKIDKKTGHPYRVNHSIKMGQQSFWIDIDEAPRNKMRMSLTLRREQMVGDGVQLTLDAEHWNNIHPSEDPLVVPLDFTEDVEWRKNGRSRN